MGGEGNRQEAPVVGDGLIPVTLLCGFLGSGKTTLLKHVLESKHQEEDFNCAVIVNDMAELNIDKSLIDQSSLIQDEGAMVGMQNGCICCTLQTDLVKQIISLTQKKKFNYILIEASGVSEPHEIAPLFELQDDEDHADHDHDAECVDLDHDDADADNEDQGPQLGEVAKLDTCVTLIDSADFYNNLGSMKTYDECDIVGTIPELMMDQVEFANVVILNKDDLVDKKQKSDLIEKVSLMNPNAKIVTTVQSKVDVKDILNTQLYKDKEEFWVTSLKNADAVEKERTGRKIPEACTARFDINSFVYRARRPFHPRRLIDNFLELFFMTPWYGDSNEETEDDDQTDEEMKESQEEKDLQFVKVQEEACMKQKKRKEIMGELLRSKGFIWLATSNDKMGGWQQAGNVLMCPMLEAWQGTDAEKGALSDMKDENGQPWDYGDRRQEIVFIGHRLNRDAVKKLLDDCLLNDEEMALGPEKWKETMEEPGNGKYFLDNESEGEDDEDVDENSETENENEVKDLGQAERQDKSKDLKRKNEQVIGDHCSKKMSF